MSTPEHEDFTMPILIGNPPSPPPAELPSLEAATSHVAVLEAELQRATEAFRLAEDRLGASYALVAEGGEAAPAALVEIESMVSRERLLRSALRHAKEALTHAQSRAVIAAVLRRRAETEALLNERDEIAAQADLHLHNLAVCLNRLVENGGRILDTVRSVRGRSTLTTQGYLPVGEVTQLAQPEHTQTMTERSLHTLLGWWRCEHAMNRTSIADSVASASAMMRMDDGLFELDGFDPADVAAVRKQLALEG